MPQRTSNDDDAPLAPGLRRRNFLAMSSVGIAGLWLGGLSRLEAAPIAVAASAATAPRPMSLGYLAGSDLLPNVIYLPLRVLNPSTRARAADPANGVLSTVVPADGLQGGDTSLVGRPLGMKIHGLYPPAALAVKRQPAMPLAVDLDVLFPPPDPVFPKPARYFAWSFRRRPGWDPSAPVKFVFPLDWQAMPEMEMRVTPAKGAPWTVSTRFTLDYETGRPRLRRGVYLLGLAPGAWQWDISLAELARAAPLGLLSVMVSFEALPAAT